jgi:hypothetical protein
VRTIAVRLVETQARGHIGRRVLHREAGGELTPGSGVALVVRPRPVPGHGAAGRTGGECRRASRGLGGRVDGWRDALAWHLESAGAGNQLIGAVEVQVTSPDHSVRTDVVRAAEPVSATLPGDLAAAAGRLLQRLASETLARVSRSR